MKNEKLDLLKQVRKKVEMDLKNKMKEFLSNNNGIGTHIEIKTIDELLSTVWKLNKNIHFMENYVGVKM